MVRLLMTIVLGFGLTLGAVGLVPQSASAFADRDCGDFSSQAAAQEFFIDAGGPHDDPHGLDYDNDGIACESNPCPCSTSTGGSGGGSTTTIVRQRARVVYVVDGDTVDVRLAGGRKVRVRLIGIDTPERGRCGYAAATRSLRNVLPVGRRVVLVSDKRQPLKDRYGRELRYVMKGTKDVDRMQVNRGWARVYVVGRGFTRVTSYRNAQAAAKAAPRGIWKIC